MSPLFFEKGGLNLANLTDEQQIEAEDDYRICVAVVDMMRPNPGDSSPKPRRTIRRKPP